MTGDNLKVALICREASLSGGGVERYAITLSRDIAGMGHRVHLFANRWDGALDRRVTPHKIPVRKGLQSVKLLSFIRNCRRLLRQEGDRFDIVCSLTQFYPQDVFRLGGSIWKVLMERLHPVRWRRLLKYMIADGYLLRSYLERKIFQEGNYRHIVAISNLVKDQLIRTYHPQEDKITVIYNGVDLNRFNQDVRGRWRKEIRNSFNLKDHDIVLLFVGHDFRRKGLEYLIGALPNIDPRVRLLVAGRGNPGAYRGMASSLGIADRVIFAGSVDKMETVYSAADIFVFPTLYDAFGSVGLEAMACGLPVITTKYSGFSELVEDHINGIVLERLGAGELTAAINGILREDIRIYLGENGAKTARRHTTMRNAEEMLRVFYRVIDQKDNVVSR